MDYYDVPTEFDVVILQTYHTARLVGKYNFILPGEEHVSDDEDECVSDDDESESDEKFTSDGEECDSDEDANFGNTHPIFIKDTINGDGFYTFDTN